MGFWDLIFGNKNEQGAAQPRIRMGRYTDSYKIKAQYDSWEKALDKFEENDYLASYRAFFEYLRDEKEDNVRWLDENGALQFEILQGSKRVSGVATAEKVQAIARIAHVEELSVAYMRRLVEANYSLDYSRYGLDDDRNLVIKFDTSSLDGSPYKLYYALKEVAINADKQDDLLLDEFGSILKPLDTGSKRDLPVAEREAKYNYLRQQIQRVFDEMDAGSLNAERFPGGISYLLLALVYRLDYLLTPEGFVMETIERIHRLYFDNDGKTPLQKNTIIRRELEKITSRTKDLIFNELYDTSSTFGILVPKAHDTLAGLIDGELPNMDWYEENGHTHVALSVTGYIVGNALFNYALPKPDRELLELYYRIFESDYFKTLGITPQYFDAAKGVFDQKAVRNAIRNVAENNREKYPTVTPNVGLLDFSTPCKFARSYLIMVKSMDVTPKN